MMLDSKIGGPWKVQGPKRGRLQMIITSYQRPLYLQRSLETLDPERIAVYVVDGGSGVATEHFLMGEFIQGRIAGAMCLEGNPGADVLKNEGIRTFVTDPHFCISSDDFLYPKDWDIGLLYQWNALRLSHSTKATKLGQFAMLACPTDLVIDRHTNAMSQGNKKRGVGYHYIPSWVPEIEIMPTSVTMVAGTMMDTACTLEAGGFPVYGKTGQGDIAISRVFRGKGYEVGYLKGPVLTHIGEAKEADYPEYSHDWNLDDDLWQGQARLHDPAILGPLR